MKKPLFLTLLFIAGLVVPPAGLRAQTFANAGEYMGAITAVSDQIQQDSWEYTSQVAHGKNARKAEKKRQVVLQTVLDSRKKIARMPAYEGDASLRDTVGAFLRIQYAVLNEDYKKIVDLEEIAEQSYDLMEAYMLAKEKAQEKLRSALDKVLEAQEAFAATHDVELIYDESEMDKKVKAANEVITYHRVHYLIHFKCTKQEMYLIDAAGRGDVNEMEQNASSLADFAKEGRGKLTAVSNFNGDRGMATATGALLDFWQNEAEKDFPGIIDFHLKKENLDKLKKDIDKTKSPSKEQVDAYNAAVAEFNGMLNAYNTQRETLNKTRSKLFEDWQKASEKFLDKHVPK